MSVLKRSHLILIAILAVAGGIFLLGNERIPLWDRDEPRYAECSREMLQSGDWVVPRFLGDLRTHKPPFIYWCQAVSMELVGGISGDAAAARLPSSIAMALTGALLGMFVWRVGGGRRAIWAALVFCTSALTIAAAKLCITDGVLLLWICVGQWCLYFIWKNRRVNWGVVLLFWISTALAGLTKGPVVLFMHLATMGVVGILEIGGRWRTAGAWKEAAGWWRRIHPIVGVVILFVMIAPWIVLVNRRAPEFLAALLNRAGRYARGGAEGHAHWPGFYLLMIWGTFFPWSLMLPTAIGMGLRHRHHPLLRFALAAAIGPWLVMELVTNKLPFYILPCFPALAILTAEAIVRSADAAVGDRDDDLKRRVFLIGVGLWGLAVLALGFGLLFLPVQLHWPSGAMMGASMGIAVVYLLIVTVLFIRRNVAAGASAMGVGMMVIAVFLFGVLAPSLMLLSGSRTVGEQLNALGAGGNIPVAMIDYREPSLAFYQGGGAREAYASDLSSATPPEWAVITTDGWALSDGATRGRYQIVGPATGTLLYNDGWGIKKLLIIRRKSAIP